MSTSGSLEPEYAYKTPNAFNHVCLSCSQVAQGSYSKMVSYCTHVCFFPRTHSARIPRSCEPSHPLIETMCHDCLGQGCPQLNAQIARLVVESLLATQLSLEAVCRGKRADKVLLPNVLAGWQCLARYFMLVTPSAIDKTFVVRHVV